MEMRLTKGTPVEAVLKIGEPCGDACGWSGHCCKFASGILIGDESAAIAKNTGLSKEEFEKDYLEDTERFNTKLKQFKQRRKNLPHGPCIMLTKDNKCSIHAFKPLYCRIGNCNKHGEQLAIWFALNHFVNPHDAESVRLWAQYLRTHPGIPGGELHELVKDPIMLKKMLVFEQLH